MFKATSIILASLTGLLLGCESETTSSVTNQKNSLLSLSSSQLTGSSNLGSSVVTSSSGSSLTTNLSSSSVQLGIVAPSLQTKAIIVSLVAITENSQTLPNYGYAENIKDGRGITFGIIGFTTGTYDGNDWLHHYTALSPNNRLAKYIPALDAIDKGPHKNGLSADVTGLTNFIADFKASVNDSNFKKSQMDKMDELYWSTALAQAQDLGVTMNITLAELFDACVNHGAGGDSVDKGLEQLIDETNAIMGGTPKSGINETLWLSAFLENRLAYLKADATWAEATDRIEMYKRILATGNTSLKAPFAAQCYGDKFTVTGENVL
jgi:chitosanase